MKTGRNVLLIASLAWANGGLSQSLLGAARAVDGWHIGRSVASTPRPWLRQKKGRGPR